MSKTVEHPSRHDHIPAHDGTRHLLKWKPGRRVLQSSDGFQSWDYLKAEAQTFAPESLSTPVKHRGLDESKFGAGFQRRTADSIRPHEDRIRHEQNRDEKRESHDSYRRTLLQARESSVSYDPVTGCERPDRAAAVHQAEQWKSTDKNVGFSRFSGVESVGVASDGGGKRHLAILQSRDSPLVDPVSGGGGLAGSLASPQRFGKKVFEGHRGEGVRSVIQNWDGYRKPVSSSANSSASNSRTSTAQNVVLPASSRAPFATYNESS